MSRLVSRNLIFRQELRRSRWYYELSTKDRTCDFCANLKRTASGAPYLYEYYTETGDGRRHVHPGLFCSKSCHDAYLGRGGN
jgi:hypothetical protein